MKERIIILTAIDGDGADLDMYPNKRVNLTLKVNEVGDLASRSSSFSNTFKVPRTANNMALLENLGTVGSDSTRPYVKTDCHYMIGSTILIKNGHLQVTKTTATEYYIVLYEGLIDLSIELGNSTVQELDYSEFDHFLEATTSVTDTFANTEGFIYALGEFGKTTGTTVDCEYLAPSVFAHTIWDKIFTSRGLTYAGSFFSTNADWKELLVPPTQGIDITEVALTPTSIGTSSPAALAVTETYESWVNLKTDFEFSTDGYDANASIDGNGDILMAYDGTIEINVTTTYTQVDTDMTLELLMDGSSFVKKTFNITPNTSPVTHVAYLLPVVTGTILKFRVASNPDTGTYPPTSFDQEYTADIDVQINTMTGGTLIEVDNYMTQSLTQIDFVKDVLQRYGLVMIRDRDNPTNYSFIQMETLLVDGASAIDWTDKFIALKDTTYKSGYAQKNFADYTYLSGVEPFLDGFILAVNDKAVLEGTIITAPYEVPAENATTLHAQPNYVIPIWEETDPDVFENKETTSKLVRLNYGSTDVGFRIFGSGITTYTPDIPYLSLVDMDYQYFFDTYYPSFETMLAAYKEVQIEVNLNLLDLTSIDFTKLIFFKQTGRYYYLNSIKTRGEVSTAQLTEVPNPNA